MRRVFGILQYNVESLFASTGITITSTTVIVLDILSVIILSIGLLCYRHLILNHNAFLHSLQYPEKKWRRKRINILFISYIVTTLIFILFTMTMYVWHLHHFQQ